MAVETARHLAGRPDHRTVPRAAHRRPAARRRAGRARRARQDARGQHHQAAQHLRLDPAAQGRDRRAAGAGLRPAGLPRQPRDRRGTRRPRPLRQGQGQRGQPGAARGQLRPPGRRRRSSSYARTHPHSMGAWTSDSKTNVATMGRRRLPVQREVGGHRGRRHAPDRARGGRRHGRPCSRRRSPVLAGEIVDATSCRSPRCTSSWPTQIARAKAEGVLFSVHLKATMMKVSDPIIFGHVVTAFFPEVFATYGDELAAAGAQPQQRSGRHPRRPRRARERAPRSGPRSRPRSPPARRWRWSTPTGASPTCTCRPT